MYAVGYMLITKPAVGYKVKCGKPKRCRLDLVFFKDKSMMKKTARPQSWWEERAGQLDGLKELSTAAAATLLGPKDQSSCVMDGKLATYSGGVIIVGFWN